MVQKYNSFHLTVGVKVVQQLKLSGSNVAEVNRLEEEEDELAAEVAKVKGGGGAVAQAGHLFEKVINEMEKKDRKKKEMEKVKYGDDDKEANHFTSFMSGARQPGQKPRTSALVNIRDWIEGIVAGLLLLNFFDILPLQQSSAD